ncbi:MAG: ion transporter [Prevotellaceae bacterium]|nr:ion transporter [Candidatus Minthosoma caballi]
MKKRIVQIDSKLQFLKMLFNPETKAGRVFEIIVMIAIALSLIVAFLETNRTIAIVFKDVLTVMEYVLTFFFTVEYILRVYCSEKPKDYIFSFFGIVDLLATLPLYLSLIPFLASTRYLFIIRAFRLIRIFRVLRLFAFINEGYLLLQSLKLSFNKIMVYFLFVLILVTIIGTVMYMVEGQLPNTQFTDIPTSIYWAIVTLTTVGYGDITPVTRVGQFLSGFVMILGYTIIAIPTGIVSATMIDETKKRGKNGRCPRCNERTDLKANYCKHCGERL